MMWGVRTLRRLWAGAFVVGMAAVPAAVFMTLFLEDEYGFGSLGRGFAQLVLGVGGAAGLVMSGRLAPRSTAEGDETPALAVHIARWLALAGLGILGTALAPIASLSVASLVVVGLGTGGLQPVLLALVARVTPVACRSVAFGVTALSLGIGAIASLGLFGLGQSSGYRTALVVAGLLALVAALVVRSARRTVPGDLARAAAPAAVGPA
jgi:predicted MFS family arabinose efflux permease